MAGPGWRPGRAAAWAGGAALVRSVTAAVVAAAAIVWLLSRSPGRLGQPAAEWQVLPWDRSWVDGRALQELVVPALANTGLRVFPALVLAVLLARALALSDSRPAGLLRRLSTGASILPVFLLGYLVILGVNHLVLARVEAGAAPPSWFALPLGDGRPHPVRWGIEVLILAVGEGVLGDAARRLRSRVEEIWQRPYVLAAAVNGDGAGPVLKRHLRGTVRRLGVALLPGLFGSAIVVEILFQEPGAGRLLVQSLTERDLPVVGCILAGGLAVMAALQALVGWLEAAERAPAPVLGGGEE